MPPVYVHRKPDAFSGTKPEEFVLWLSKFRATAAAQQWGDDEALRHIIPVYLSGYAYQLYASLADTETDTYEHLIDALKLKLGIGENPLQWRLRLQRTNREAGESLDAFAYKLRNLVTHGYPGLAEGDDFNDKIIEQFILGNTKDLRFHLLKAEETKTLAQVIKSAKVYEMASEIALGSKSIHNMEISELSQSPEVAGEQHAEPLLLNAVTNASGISPTPVNGFQSPYGGACFQCGQFGHMARNCPRSHSQQPECYKCRQMGHISRFCPGPVGSAPRYQSISSNQSSPKASSPTICQRCGNRNHTADKCRTNISIYCQQCQKKGHSASVCRSRPADHGNARDAFSSRPQAVTYCETPKNETTLVPEGGDWS